MSNYGIEFNPLSVDNTSFPIGQNIRFLTGVQKVGWEGRVIRDWFMEYDAEFSDQEITNFSDTLLVTAVGSTKLDDKPYFFAATRTIPS
jgi:hypothetical protein